jgi:hypothetical protein
VTRRHPPDNTTVGIRVSTTRPDTAGVHTGAWAWASATLSAVVSLDRWATIWPVGGHAEFAPTQTVNGRELEPTMLDYSNWLGMPSGPR